MLAGWFFKRSEEPSFLKRRKKGITTISDEARRVQTKEVQSRADIALSVHGLTPLADESNSCPKAEISHIWASPDWCCSAFFIGAWHLFPKCCFNALLSFIARWLSSG